MPHRRTTTLRLGLIFVAILLLANAVLSALFVNYLQIVHIRQVQEGVRVDLNSAREVFAHEVSSIERTLRGAALQSRLVGTLDGTGEPCDPQHLRRLMEIGDLDVLALLGADADVVCLAEPGGEIGLSFAGDPLVERAWRSGRPVSGTSVLPAATLAALDPAVAARAAVTLVDTPAARPTSATLCADGLIAQAVVPVVDAQEHTVGLLWGATLLNGRADVVDALRGQVFPNRVYEGRDVGTATLFLGDVRVATTVLDSAGERAIGTRMSAAVAERVLEQGGIWADRAFVVNDWYITAYEPLRDPSDRVIGALYVGMLEAPLQHQRRVTALVFLAIVASITAVTLAVLLSATREVLRPIGRIVAMSQKVVQGDLTARVGLDLPGELGALCGSVDEMADAVLRREQRLKELTRAQLTQSEKLASVGRLAAGIAHEVNNPLTGVLTFAHLLREKPHMQREDIEDLDVICKETARVRDIIRGLLDFARESPSQRVSVDLNQLVQETIRLLRTQKVFRNVGIEESLDLALPSMVGDPNQLKQVLLNLMLNACEAMHSGGVLTLRTRRRGAEAEVDVADTGCGIPAENLDKVFEPFFTTKPVGKGTGLGLSVSYGIVQAHGGRIAVASRPGEGATFTVTLPVAAPEPCTES